MKRICALILLIALLLCVLSACAQPEEPVEQFELWFVSTSDDGSVALSTEIYSGVESVPAVMEALLAGPGPMIGLTTPIPRETELLDWDRVGTTVQVDLSRTYGELEGMELTLADYCIALTLTQLEGVEAVRITVDGATLPGRRQLLHREDVVFSGAEEEPVELIAALSFRRAGGNELGVEQRMFRLTESQSATLAVLQALLAGPHEAGLQPLLPEAEVYSARVEAGVCYADFSAALLEQIPESEEEQQLVIRSIVESLCSWGYVQAVQIMVEGEPLTWYGQVDVSKPLN